MNLSNNYIVPDEIISDILSAEGKWHKVVTEFAKQDLVNNVSWVSSKSRALKALSRNQPSTYVHVEHSSANNRNGDEVGKAHRI